MKKFVVALFLLPVLFLTVGAKPKPADAAALPPYEIIVTIHPVEDSPIQLLPHQWRNAFRCSATITDFTTGAPQASVETIVQPGRRATEIGKANGLTVLFGVEIDENREGARSEVVLKRGDQVLVRQRTTTRFAPAPRTFRGR